MPCSINYTFFQNRIEDDDIESNIYRLWDTICIHLLKLNIFHYCIKRKIKIAH